MWWSVRRPLFPYKVGHPHMPPTRAARGLRHFVHPRGPLRYHTLRRDARCARFRKPHSAARGANTHVTFQNVTYAGPATGQPAVRGVAEQPPADRDLLCPSTPPPTRQSRRLTVRGVDAWLCGEIDLWICRPVLRANLHERRRRWPRSRIPTRNSTGRVHDVEYNMLGWICCIST